MIIAIARTMAMPRKTRPAIRYLLADSITKARSRWWKRRRWVALGAIRQIVDTAVASSVSVEERALRRGDVLEALRERDRQQEREEDLHARQGDAELVQQLQHLPVALLLLVLSCHGEPDVVAGDEREQRGVHAVERAAVGPEQGPRVLRTHVALDQ